MSSDNSVDWAAALAEIEARIAKLQTTADGIREIMASTGVTAPTGGPGGGVRSDAFLKMSIPDATKKLLEIKREKQSTQEILDGLEKGGLPRSKYATVYSILTRRQNQIGDIINMKGDWALAEWYPNRPKGKAVKDAKATNETKENEEATA